MSTLWVPLLIAGICLVLEALFSSTEIAIVSADRAHIRRLAQEGHRGARLVEDFLIAPHRLLATTLLGTQFAVVTSTVVITLWLYAHHRRHVELYLLLFLTPVIVTFGEIVPKAIVRQHANRLAPLMALFLHYAMKVLWPAVSLLARVSSAVSRRLGIDLHHKLVTREEIESLVSVDPEQSGDPGVQPVASDVTADERSMIQRIFEFTDSTADILMKPLSDVLAMPETVSVADLAREIADKKYSRIPIYRERIDQIVGVVHAFDVLKAARSSATAKDLMREPVFVPESCQSVDLFVRLERARQALAIVVDEYGGAVGIVTVEDLLEEVVGEINDEYDEAPPAISRQKDGSYRVQARTSVDQLNRELKLDLPESDEYESLAGLLLEKLKHIPRPGEQLRIGSVTIEVLVANERRIEEVVLRLGKKKGT
ncbi:MAG: hemolysin family protein [Polyangia bacterium]